MVYELFFTPLPQEAFTACDVVALYLHRGASAPTLADEDQEQDPDRWCSHSPAGQEAWQIINQWVWNLRLELGHQLHPDPLRTTEFAPACPLAQEETGDPHLPYKDMDRQMWPCPGNEDASLVATLPSSRMGRCTVLPGRRFVQTLGARKAMEVCAWWMRPVSTVAAPVLCASSVNAMAKPLANLAR
jgi:hypothetical protein